MSGADAASPIADRMLEVRDLEVAYGAAPALWGVSLDVRAGELLCVVGPNGAGKTTLINAIAGIQPARGGRIVFDGRDITRLPPHRFCAAGIAIVPEGRRLFTGMTVRENLELGSYLPAAKARRRESLAEALALFPALEGQARQPGRRALGRPAADGRDRARADGAAAPAAARRAVARPRAADRRTPCSPPIRRINADGVSVLLVEQNVAMAMAVADRAYVLEEGRIVAEGEPARAARAARDPARLPRRLSPTASSLSEITHAVSHDHRRQLSRSPSG